MLLDQEDLLLEETWYLKAMSSTYVRTFYENSYRLKDVEKNLKSSIIDD